MDIVSYAWNTFLGIPLDVYSTFLSIGVLWIAFFLIISIVVYIFSKSIRAKMHAVSEKNYLKIIGIFALLSTVFALIYQFGYLLVVCELCWWQRIFMFPIEFVVASSLIMKSRGNSLAIFLLAIFGTFFAGYHYFLHFQSWVLKQEWLSFSNCTMGGILPSCTDPAGVLIFGFLTIPFMALVIFATILWLSFLALRSHSKNKNI